MGTYLTGGVVSLNRVKSSIKSRLTVPAWMSPSSAQLFNLIFPKWLSDKKHETRTSFSRTDHLSRLIPYFMINSLYLAHTSDHHKTHLIVQANFSQPTEFVILENHTYFIMSVQLTSTKFVHSCALLNKVEQK